MSISFLGQQQRVDNLGVAYCEILGEFVFGQIVTDALLERGLPKKEEVRHAMEVAFHLAAAACCFHHGGSAPENDPPEAAHGDGKIDRADDEHGQKRPPDEGEISAAEQHRLRKGDEMRRRTDCPHHILQPDGHAFHRGAAAGKQLGGRENRHCQQPELTHGRRERAEEDSEGP